jgi:glycosyltransferase involved in cell wall biosynthesis
VAKYKHENGLISVLTLTCNSSRFVAETLQSLVDQTYQNWEVLILDDASTDDSVETVMSYVRTDTRIRFLGSTGTRRGQNGIAPLRNRCLRAARGEFVGVLDSDDVRYRRSLEVSVAALTKAPDFGIVSTQYEEIDDSGRVRSGSTCLHARRRITAQAEPWFVDITQLVLASGGGAACPIAPCATVLRKEVVDAVGGYNEVWKYHTDSNLYRRLARHAGVRFCILPDVLSAHRVHSGQRTAAKKLEGWVEPREL